MAIRIPNPGEVSSRAGANIQPNVRDAPRTFLMGRGVRLPTNPNTANAEMFGGAEGRALQTLANGIGKVGKEFERVALRVANDKNQRDIMDHEIQEQMDYANFQNSLQSQDPSTWVGATEKFFRERQGASQDFFNERNVSPAARRMIGMNSSEFMGRAMIKTAESSLMQSTRLARRSAEDAIDFYQDRGEFARAEQVIMESSTHLPQDKELMLRQNQRNEAKFTLKQMATGAPEELRDMSVEEILEANPNATMADAQAAKGIADRQLKNNQSEQYNQLIAMRQEVDPVTGEQHKVPLEELDRMEAEGLLSGPQKTSYINFAYGGRAVETDPAALKEIRQQIAGLQLGPEYTNNKLQLQAAMSVSALDADALGAVGQLLADKEKILKGTRQRAFATGEDLIDVAIENTTGIFQEPGGRADEFSRETGLKRARLQAMESYLNWFTENPGATDEQIVDQANKIIVGTALPDDAAAAIQESFGIEGASPFSQAREMFKDFGSNRELEFSEIQDSNGLNPGLFPPELVQDIIDSE